MSGTLIVGCQCRRIFTNFVRKKIVSEQISTNWKCATVNYHQTHLSKRTFSASHIFYQSSESASEDMNSDGKSEDEFYDIVITGGGMVGTSLASAIGQDPMFGDRKLLLLEASKQSSFVLSETYSNRVCALSPATQDFLANLGAWDEISVMRQQPVKRMQVWDACSDALITFDRDGEGPLASIVENDVILEALRRSLDFTDGSVDVRYESKVGSFKLPHQTASRDLVRVQLDSGESIATKLLVGADGANSALREAAGVHHVGWDYGAAGLVATLHLEESQPNHCAWQRFLPTGPIALLPLSDTASSLVWSTSLEEAERLLSLTADQFVDAVNQAYLDDSDKDRVSTYAHDLFNELLSAFLPDNKAFNRQFPPRVSLVEEGSRAKFPLGLGHASHYVQARMALVGDSAHRIHPLAGQGVNLGFADAKCLADVIGGVLTNGGDVGSIHSLLEYETVRQRHVLPLMAGIDGLSRLYSTTITPVVLARTLGLQATNAIKPLKNWFMDYAIAHR